MQEARKRKKCAVESLDDLLIEHIEYIVDYLVLSFCCFYYCCCCFLKNFYDYWLVVFVVVRGLRQIWIDAVDGLNSKLLHEKYSKLIGFIKVNLGLMGRKVMLLIAMLIVPVLKLLFNSDEDPLEKWVHFTPFLLSYSIFEKVLFFYHFDFC